MEDKKYKRKVLAELGLIVLRGVLLLVEVVFHSGNRLS